VLRPATRATGILTAGVVLGATAFTKAVTRPTCVVDAVVRTAGGGTSAVATATWSDHTETREEARASATSKENVARNPSRDPTWRGRRRPQP